MIQGSSQLVIILAFLIIIAFSVPNAYAQASNCDPYGETLQLNSFGPKVTELQTDLTTLEYGDLVGAIDGSFGPSTENAVRSFQRDNGLVDDGVVGPATWGAICSALLNSGPTPPGPSPSQNNDLAVQNESLESEFIDQ